MSHVSAALIQLLLWNNLTPGFGFLIYKPGTRKLFSSTPLHSSLNSVFLDAAVYLSIWIILYLGFPFGFRLLFVR